MKSFDDVRRSGGSFGVVFSMRGVTALGVVGFVAVAACSSSSSKTGTVTTPLQCQTPPAEIADAAALVTSTGGACAVMGGATPGAQDMHCSDGDGGEMRQLTAASACCGTTDASGDDGGYSEACNDAGNVVGAVDDGTCCGNAYGPTMWGNSGGDDDCKYDVSWTSTPVCLGASVYFTVHANIRAGAGPFGSGPPLTGAGPYAEVILDCTKVASAKQPDPVESSPGVYQVGPIVFTEPGQWSVRFHFNENCYDELPDSPHGHAAFWVTVPEVDGAIPATSGTTDASADAASSDAAVEAVEQ
jgi:hypothetical protein